MIDRETVVAAFEWFQPPKEHASARQIRQWHWKVFIMVGGLIVGVGIHIALACGVFSSVFPGFARADTVLEIQTTTLEAQILETRKNQCSSQGQANVLYTAAIQKLLIKYNEVTGRVYPLPACEDFR